MWLFQMKAKVYQRCISNSVALRTLEAFRIQLGSVRQSIVFVACQLMAISGLRPFSRLIDLALRKTGMTNYEDLIVTASNSPIRSHKIEHVSSYKATLVGYACNTGAIDGLKSNISISRSKPQRFVSVRLGCIIFHS